MAKTDWTFDDVVQPADMNQIGQEINENAARIAETQDETKKVQLNIKRTLAMGGML